jgi:hypothetical protein
MVYDCIDQFKVKRLDRMALIEDFLHQLMKMLSIVARIHHGSVWVEPRVTFSSDAQRFMSVQHRFAFSQILF